MATAALMATGATRDGHREILGLELGSAEDGATCTQFLRGWSPAACTACA